MRILSWNVNGLRAAERAGFASWLSRCGADVVLLQEVRAHPDQISRSLRCPARWHAFFHPAQRKGYSGVALYSRRQPDDVVEGLGLERFDAEGRVLAARFGKLLVVGAYFPNGGRACERVPFKLEFYAAMLEELERLRRRGYHVVIAGDYNTAHRPEDLARPKENAKTSGFLPVEREWLDRYVAAGWVDSFRHLHPGATGRYTWWTQRVAARERNIGWRLDYCFVDAGLREHVKAATIHPRVLGSDHCPVGLELA